MRSETKATVFMLMFIAAMVMVTARRHQIENLKAEAVKRGYATEVAGEWQWVDANEMVESEGEHE
jgi:hypothetical protein